MQKYLKLTKLLTLILSFLQDGQLPQDIKEARKVRKRAARFTILNDTLYKRGFSMPYLKCVNKEEAKYTLEEIHEGICRDHAGPRSLISKVIRSSYFWPTLQKDAKKFVKKCDKCQRFGNVQCIPSEKLMTIASPWPFAQWGLDIIGPLPQGKRQVKFLIVVIDYFTKWVETEAKVQNFMWKNIVCRFGIPQIIISNNGQQFDSQGFRDFCSGLGIKNQFSSPGHSQANGQMEVTNRTLLKIIKAQLDNANGAWPEELPNVLWAYRPTPRTPTGETPFSLTHGIKAIIPVEIGITNLRREVFHKGSNDNQLRINLDCLDESRDKASRKMAKY